MQYLIVNLDKKQYIRPIALGGAQGRKEVSLFQSDIERHAYWMARVWELLELGRQSSPLSDKKTDIQSGAWAGDRIVAVYADDQSTIGIDDATLTLATLGQTPISSFEYIRKNYRDLTPLLKKEQVQERREQWYRILTQVGRKLTDVRAGSLPKILKQVASRGQSCLRAYLEWLLKRPNLTVKARKQLKETKEKLDQEKVLVQPAVVSAPASN